MSQLETFFRDIDRAWPKRPARKIDAMVERDLVPHDKLLDRFRSAFAEFTYDARAAELPKYVENLHRVERDMLGVSETEFDLSCLRY